MLSPAELTKASAENTTEDVLITSTCYTEPGNPTILAKHNAKEELPAADRSKMNLYLQNYADFSAGELHAGYLSRLHTSRDMEASLVNMMRRNYEVQIKPLSTGSYAYSCVAPKGRPILPRMSRVFKSLTLSKTLCIKTVAPKGRLNLIR